MLGGLKLAAMATILGCSLSSMAASEANAPLPSMMPCDQALKMTSTEFIDKYTQQHGDNTLERINAIYEYGNCYSQHLDNLQAQMNESGHHPLMGANANYREFEKVLNDFTNTAMSFCSPDGTLKRVSAAYAVLYQKQFRNYFYQQYLPKGKIPTANSKTINAAKAKLEEVIKQLPARQKEQAIKSFSAYYDAAVTTLGLPAQPVYEYAIMILQSPADKPFSPPPF